MSKREQVCSARPSRPEVYTVASIAACVLLGFTFVGALHANTNKQAEQPPENPPDKQADKNKRGTPTIQTPTEGRVEIAFTQVQSYILTRDPNDHENIMILRGEKPTGPPPRPEMKSEWMRLEKLGDLKTGHPADTVQPTRMALIVASFPYKKQLQEFKDRLHLKSELEVVNEMGPTEKDPATMRNTFAFVRPLIQRRRVDIHGKPLEDWTAIAQGDYRELLRCNGMRFEPEPQEIDAVSFDGLVMPKLAVMGKGQYPDVEARLADLQTTLTALAKTKPEQIVKPKNPPNKDGSDPFEKPQPPKDIKPNAATVIPEYCLIRLIDVDIHPGQFYQYRIKVRMANPNFGMKNVAVAADAKLTKPLESEWFEIRPKNEVKPQVVALPSEYHLYTMDQKEIEKEKYRGQNDIAIPEKDRQAVFQIHKWLETIDPNPPIFIGEWSVAERVLAYRGEYIGRRERVEVPYWRSTQECFVLAVEPTSSSIRRPLKGIVVDFGEPPTEGRSVTDYPILIDFEGGAMTYSRVSGNRDGKEQVVRITETVGVETLILSPDGKLLSHASWNDKSDKERINRLDSWRQRIKDVKEGK